MQIETILADPEVKLRPVPLPLTREHIIELVDKCNDTRGVVNDIFIATLYKRIQQMIYERGVQGLRAFEIEELRLIIHMSLLAATLTAGKMRDSGTGSVFEEHLDDAVGESIKTMARTRPSLIAATYGHDIIEDTSIKTFEDFWRVWCETFKDANDVLLKISKPIAKRIWDLIDAVTKVRKKTRPETRDATLRKLFGALIRLGPDVLYLKFSDRLSNLKTLHVHSRDKQEEIAEETYEVYCRLGEIFGMHEFVRVAVDLCGKVLNEDLLNDFTRIRDERIAERLDHKKIKLNTNGRKNGREEREISVREYLNAIFDSNDKPSVHAQLLDGLQTRVVPKSLANFVLKTDKPLNTLKLDDLGISPLASLFEIAVTVRPGTSIAAVRDYIMRACKKSKERYEFIDRDPNQLPQRGAILIIHSEALGTLRFRINDEIAEKRSRRGILPVASEQQAIEGNRLPPRVHRAVNRILQESALEPGSTLRLARELLLHPTIMVYTRDNRPVELPNGATAQDLAGAIHPDLLISLQQGAIWHKPTSDDPSETEAVPIDIFDPLKPGMRVELIANTGEERRGSAGLAGNPGRLLFCRRATATELCHKGFGKRGPGDSPQPIIENGKKYLLHLAKLFGLLEEDLLQDVEAALIKRSAEEAERERRIATERRRRIQARREQRSGSQASAAVRIEGAAGTARVTEGPETAALEKAADAELLATATFSRDEIYEKIGSGEIEPLSILSRGRFKDREAWKIRVELPHAPHTLEQFMAQLHTDINADRIVQIPKPAPQRQAVRFDLVDIGDTDGARSSFQMMKMLLRLSAKYDLSLEHRQWQKRVRLKLVDVYRLVVDSLSPGKKKRTQERSNVFIAA